MHLSAPEELIHHGYSLLGEGDVSMPQPQDIKGHLYLDQVNLDRYDGIIGTPFMNRHGVILDFGKSEICFPSGKTIRALSAPEEASILQERHPREYNSKPAGV
ncbi:hypothetical protein B0H17DRAFT_1135737 [Mycena rosella]|uniref:Uncharacterized protein n=1 Tax=Mycena rosella TaxID=1033263 RepID=A0AAD7DCS3_MYCRO|nr:hypothetical protein B0H17DRAFT_1135737 [Mycena rosella]